MPSKYVLSNGLETVTVDPAQLLPEGDRLAASGDRVTILEQFEDGTARWLVPPGGITPTGKKPDTIPAPPPENILTATEFAKGLTSAAAILFPPAANVPSIDDRNAAPVPDARSTWGATIVQDDAARGIAAEHQVLTEEGFALPTAYYTIGTLLADVGVRTFQAKKDAWEKAPRIEVACQNVRDQVRDEDRKDIPIAVGDCAMQEDGSIRVSGTSFALTSNVFTDFCSRVGMPAASEYLRKCDPSLRAYNVNAWIERNAAKRIMLRTMLGEGSRRVYGIVSQAYGECNADKIAEAMQLAMKRFPEARGHITYDGEAARIAIETEFMSPIQPEKAAVGEVWRATVRAFGDDTGGGSIKGGGGVSMALCLNFTYADVNGYSFQIRHLGRMQDVVNKLRAGIQTSLKQVEGLVTRWGYACAEDVVGKAAGLAAHEGQTMPIPVSLALPWLFNGILERDLVPVRGKREEILKKLVVAHERDESSAVRGGFAVSRASITNAFTRFAHEELTDAWEIDEVQRKASALLWSDCTLPVANPSK